MTELAPRAKKAAKFAGQRFLYLGAVVLVSGVISAIFGPIGGLVVLLMVSGGYRLYRITNV